MKEKILITVKTYPLPSRKYQELVCTAGVREDGSWVRLYPVAFRYLPFGKQFKKYSWIELETEKNPKDMRKESYRPVNSEDIKILEVLGTENNWMKRKEVLFQRPLLSLCELIKNFRKDNRSCDSLAIVKPREINDFKITPQPKEWKPEWQALFEQESLFSDYKQKTLDKVPYRFSYSFLCNDEDCSGHNCMIEDWEIFQLYRTLNKEPNEETRLQKVREKYFTSFVENNDLYFFMGTTLEFHIRKGTNPFIIIGLFYPKKEIPASDS